jgi:basic membrane protein A
VKTFKEEQGSYLVGVAAALKTKTKHVRLHRRQPKPADHEVLRRVRPGREVRDAEHQDRREAPRPVRTPGLRRHDGARVAAEAMYQGGADIIYTAAGRLVGRLVPVGRASGKSSPSASTPTSTTPSGPDPAEGHPDLDAQAVDTAVLESVKEFQDVGKVTSGSYGLDKDGVGYSPSAAASTTSSQARGQEDRRRQDPGSETPDTAARHGRC